MKPIRQKPGRYIIAGLLCLVALVASLLFVGCGPPQEDVGRTQNKASGAAETITADTSKTEKEATEGGDAKIKAAETEGRMSVREMVGQMFVVGMAGTEPDYYIEKMIRERNIGGVLLFGYNMESKEQTLALTESLQGLALATEPAAPLFVAVDHEGGEVSHAPWVSPQPSAAELGARGYEREVRGVSEQIGLELRQAGVNTDLAPVVDTGYGSAIGNRSFSEDPDVVSRLGAATVNGFQDAGVVSSAKHFPNHGVAVSDSHTSLPVVEHDMQTIESYDLPPFRAAVQAGVPMVMVGHLLYPAIDPDLPASLSPKAIGILREDLGFDGVVASDDLAMAGAVGSGTPAQATVAAVKAGVDLLLISSPPQQQADAYEAVVRAVENGEISRKQVENSVRRIEKVKGEYPLYGKS